MFEFDHNKSVKNKAKHGIDFVKAQELWFDFYVSVSVKRDDEIRQLNIGKIDGLFWTVISTVRNGVIRIISARRSRKNEKELYDEKRN